MVLISFGNSGCNLLLTLPMTYENNWYLDMFTVHATVASSLWDIWDQCLAHLSHLKHSFQIELEMVKKECFIRCLLQQPKKKWLQHTRSLFHVWITYGRRYQLSKLDNDKDVVLAFLVQLSLCIMIICWGGGLDLGWGFEGKSFLFSFSVLSHCLCLSVIWTTGRWLYILLLFNTILSLFIC